MYFRSYAQHKFSDGNMNSWTRVNLRDTITLVSLDKVGLDHHKHFYIFRPFSKYLKYCKYFLHLESLLNINPDFSFKGQAWKYIVKIAFYLIQGLVAPHPQSGNLFSVTFGFLCNHWLIELCQRMECCLFHGNWWQPILKSKIHTYKVDNTDRKNVSLFSCAECFLRPCF